MMGVAIVERELSSGWNRMEGVKFRSFPDNSHERIGSAGVIDEPETCGFLGSVNGFAIVHFHNGNPPLRLGAFSSFPLANALSGVFSDFLPWPQWDVGE